MNNHHSKCLNHNILKEYDDFFKILTWVNLYFNYKFTQDFNHCRVNNMHVRKYVHMNMLLKEFCFAFFRREDEDKHVFPPLIRNLYNHNLFRLNNLSLLEEVQSIESQAKRERFG